MKKKLFAILTLIVLTLISCNRNKTYNETAHLQNIDSASPISITPAELAAQAAATPINKWIKHFENKIRGRKITWEVTFESVTQHNLPDLKLKYKVYTNNGSIIFFVNDQSVLSLKKGQTVIFEGLIQHVMHGGSGKIEVYPARIKK